jgi:DNA-binding CsgD family transcriptional regulator
MARPHAVPIALSDEQVELLHKRLRAHTLAGRDRLRFSIILLSNQKLTNQQIAAQLGCHPETVSKWRSRFARLGLEGLLDAPRTGRPRSFSPSTGEFDHCLGV